MKTHVIIPLNVLYDSLVAVSEDIAVHLNVSYDSILVVSENILLGHYTLNGVI